MSEASAAPVDPAALIRQKSYRILLILAAIIGLLVSFASWCFLELVHWVQHEVYESLPSDLGYHSPPAWWPLPPLAVAGILAAVAIVRLPGLAAPWSVFTCRRQVLEKPKRRPALSAHMPATPLRRPAFLDRRNHPTKPPVVMHVAATDGLIRQQVRQPDATVPPRGLVRAAKAHTPLLTWGNPRPVNGTHGEPRPTGPVNRTFTRLVV